MENYNKSSMRTNKLTTLRYRIASTLWYIFHNDKEYSKVETKNIYYFYNIPNFNGYKKVLRQNSKKPLIKHEDWMTYEILYSMWIQINNKIKPKNYYRLGNCYRTNSKDDIWVSLGIYKEDKEVSSELKELIENYKSLKDIKSIQALIGGMRKYFNAYRVTIENIFNKKWIDKISNLFNGYNFTHNNLIGEEIHDENGKVKIKSKNSKLPTMDVEKLKNICEFLVKSLNLILIALENEKLLRE